MSKIGGAKMEFLKEYNGKLSLIRIGAFIAIIMGASMSLCGVIGFFMSLKDSAVFASLGAGLITTALGLKAWQKKNETK